MLASPKGGQAPIDPMSNAKRFQTDSTRRFDPDDAAKARLAATIPLNGVSPAGFDTVFYPGGHGPSWDLAEDAHSIELIRSFLAAGKPVALVCHAPGVLRHVKAPNGRPLVEGRKLILQGALYSKGDDMAPYVVEDGLLITGQNRASSTPAASLLLERLAASKQAA